MSALFLQAKPLAYAIGQTLKIAFQTLAPIIDFATFAITGIIAAFQQSITVEFFRYAIAELSNWLKIASDTTRAAFAPIAKLISGFNQATGAAGYMREAIVVVVSTLTALAIINLVTAAFGALKTVMVTTTKVTKIFNFALLKNPIFLIGTAIAIAVAGLIYFRDEITAFFQTVGTIAQQFWADIKAGWQTLGFVIREFGIGSQNYFISVFNKIKAGVNEIIAAINYIKPGTDIALLELNELAEQSKLTATEFFNEVRNQAGVTRQSVGEIYDDFLAKNQMSEDAIDRFFNKFKNAKASMAFNENELFAGQELPADGTGMPGADANAPQSLEQTAAGVATDALTSGLNVGAETTDMGSTEITPGISAMNDGSGFMTDTETTGTMEGAMSSMQDQQQMPAPTEPESGGLFGRIHAGLSAVAAHGRSSAFSINESFSKQMKSWSKNGTKNLNIMSEGFKTFSQLAMKQGGKTAKFMKKVQIAEAIFNAYGAIARAFKDHEFPRSAAVASIVAAKTFQQVNAIKSTNVGQAHAGMSSIPRDGSWYLRGGERIIPPRQNLDLTNYLRENNRPPDNQSPTEIREIHLSPTEHYLGEMIAEALGDDTAPVRVMQSVVR